MAEKAKTQHDGDASGGGLAQPRNNRPVVIPANGEKQGAGDEKTVECADDCRVACVERPSSESLRQR